MFAWLIDYCVVGADAAEVHLDERERHEPRGGAAEPGAGAPHVTPHQEHKQTTTFHFIDSFLPF
jgi:hypothetical protein